MIWPQPSKDAERFAAALEGRREHRGELPELVRLAESLGDAAVDPAPEFLADLRAELMVQAPSVLLARPAATGRNRPAHSSRRGHKRLVAAAIGAIAVAGTLGITVTSAQALPGDMLYPVKRGVETVQLSLHRGDADRGEFQLRQASKRLDEARSLAGRSGSSASALLSQSLTDFASEASAGAQALFEDFNDAGNRASINTVVAFANRSNSDLTALRDKLRPASVPAFGAAATAVNDLASRAATLCDECDRAELTDLASGAHSAAPAPQTIKSVTPADSGKLQQPVQPVLRSPATATTTVPTAPPPTPGLPITTPIPKPIVKPPIDIGAATKPIVGALLGDDGQQGLVPGLLGGLLGDD